MTDSNEPDNDSVAEIEEVFSTTSLLTTASIYSLDHETYPWLSLVPPESELETIPNVWSSTSSSTGWRIDIVRVFGVAGESALAMAVTQRQTYTSDLMYSLYISILVLGGIPIVGIVLYLVYYLGKKLLKVQSNIRESQTNI